MTNSFTREESSKLATRVVLHTAMKMLIMSLDQKDDGESKGTMEDIFHDVTEMIVNFKTE